MPALVKNPTAELSQLPENFKDSKAELQFQGAEALVYKTTFPVAASDEDSGVPAWPAFLKHRPSKPYRHPILDAKLTRHRILAEARVLVRLRREGIAVPAVYALDWEAGWMLGEWIEGEPVRAVLEQVVPLWLASSNLDIQDTSSQSSGALGDALLKLMTKIGALVGKMHSVGVVHGDLTTSNLLLRDARPKHNLQEPLDDSAIAESLEGDVFLIDFGLVAQSIQDEDRAVDLYVLERAFGSSHPQTESLFQELLKSYGKSFKGAHIVLKRLNEVRLRGRKKIMIG